MYHVHMGEHKSIHICTLYVHTYDPFKKLGFVFVFK